MKRLISTLLAFGLIAGPLAATPADAQRRTDQGEARKEMRAGNIMRAREIENRIVPMMGDAEYLGFDYDFHRDGLSPEIHQGWPGALCRCRCAYRTHPAPQPVIPSFCCQRNSVQVDAFIYMNETRDCIVEGRN